MSSPSGWQPADEFGLYNPAYMCLLARRFVDGYYKEVQNGCLLPLLVVGLTMSLNVDTRSSLTMRITTNFVKWVSDNPRNVAKIQANAPSMTQPSREGVVFGLRHGFLEFSSGLVVPGLARLVKAIRGDTDDFVESQRAAHYLGRWFSTAGPAGTTLALLGVRP